MTKVRQILYNKNRLIVVILFLMGEINESDKETYFLYVKFVITISSVFKC